MGRGSNATPVVVPAGNPAHHCGVLSRFSRVTTEFRGLLMAGQTGTIGLVQATTEDYDAEESKTERASRLRCARTSPATLFTIVQVWAAGSGPDRIRVDGWVCCGGSCSFHPVCGNRAHHDNLYQDWELLGSPRKRLTWRRGRDGGSPWSAVAPSATKTPVAALFSAPPIPG